MCQIKGITVNLRNELLKQCVFVYQYDCVFDYSKDKSAGMGSVKCILK